jgi:hypothetical protein
MVTVKRPIVTDPSAQVGVVIGKRTVNDGKRPALRIGTAEVGVVSGESAVSARRANGPPFADAAIGLAHIVHVLMVTANVSRV